MSGKPQPAGYSDAMVLVRAPVLAGGSAEMCIDLLRGESGQPAAVLGVTFASAERWLKRLDAPARTASVGVVSMGDLMRTKAQATPEIVWTSPTDSPIVSSVQPGDLTGLGILMNQYLDAWGNQSWGGECDELRVCFDSVTALLQYNKIETVFRFLNVLTAYLREVDAGAHFHLDPDAHDSQTIATLSQLFDSVVDIPHDHE